MDKLVNLKKFKLNKRPKYKLSKISKNAYAQKLYVFLK